VDNADAGMKKKKQAHRQKKTGQEKTQTDDRVDRGFPGQIGSLHEPSDSDAEEETYRNCNQGEGQGIGKRGYDKRIGVELDVIRQRPSGFRRTRQAGDKAKPENGEEQSHDDQYYGQDK